jgi:hypothetical protein
VGSPSVNQPVVTMAVRHNDEVHPRQVNVLAGDVAGKNVGITTRVWIMRHRRMREKFGSPVKFCLSVSRECAKAHFLRLFGY